MLRQSSVNQIRAGQINRSHGYIVICMCFYPRGLRQDLRDEYRADLAPNRNLFKEWQSFAQTAGHDAAFRKSHYEDRFSLSDAALEHLRMLAEWSTRQDIFLVCQCEVGERCHREILLRMAAYKFGITVDRIFNEYLRIEERLRTTPPLI